ncbi:hypothetical protein [Pedobacter sp. GR22-10]|uniref:hypothetical protein n=1 Tax=Pedobacter sp. GR22-10 TaxID=2994472 RepID=UPI002247A82C|nr:hypothetical protein [Pedobacter sp. GR22-10]MCX2429842.1 hypothetical protein [Pedobacter sp. GR22-10]
MQIDFNKKYDIVKIIDIPENEISEELKKELKNIIRYKDSHADENIYNTDDYINEPAFNGSQEAINELEAIATLCFNNGAIYFRITEA